MIDLKQYEVWFVTGSQHLYGEETLKQVAENSKKIAAGLDEEASIVIKIVWKPTVTTPAEIRKLCIEANTTESCIGLITWMHTFSPAKMWISGLQLLQKPILHLHTQYNREIPWSSIDMDFMNLNQSAHGGREYGFILSRMRQNRKVVVGFWQDAEVKERVAIWVRVAAAWADSNSMKIARFGDNMREVAVTEGDKVEAEMRFGYSVNGYGVGDLVEVINSVTIDELDAMYHEYETQYKIADNLKSDSAAKTRLKDAAKIEVGMRKFLEKGGFSAFTTTFENLHGISQLPGLAAQRLMADGYGFGAEGDWKTAALVRSMKVMSHDLPGGTSFMEDYTYHMTQGNAKVLGAHMLEVCPSIAKETPRLEMHPLGIGGKDDPARLVFESNEGAGFNASIMDMGNRFRLVVSTVDVVKADAPLPNLPVASTVWVPHPDLRTAAAAWIYAGGAHHTGFSLALTPEYMEDFADIADIEYLIIDKDTKIREFKNEIRWNDAAYRIGK